MNINIILLISISKGLVIQSSNLFFFSNPLTILFFFSALIISWVGKTIISRNHEPSHQLKSEGSLLCYLHPNPACVSRSPAQVQRQGDKEEGKGEPDELGCSVLTVPIEVSLRLNSLGVLFIHNAPNTSCPVVTQRKIRHTFSSLSSKAK